MVTAHYATLAKKVDGKCYGFAYRLLPYRLSVFEVSRSQHVSGFTFLRGSAHNVAGIDVQKK